MREGKVKGERDDIGVRRGVLVLENCRPWKSAGDLPIDEEAKKHDILRIYIYKYIYLFIKRER